MSAPGRSEDRDLGYEHSRLELDLLPDARQKGSRDPSLLLRGDVHLEDMARGKTERAPLRTPRPVVVCFGAGGVPALRGHRWRLD